MKSLVIEIPVEKIEEMVKDVVLSSLDPLKDTLKKEVEYLKSSKNLEELLKIDEVVKIVKMGKSTIFKQVKDGVFPKPVRVGENLTRWKRSEIERYIAGLEVAA